jgi:hypothetical protein
MISVGLALVATSLAQARAARASGPYAGPLVDAHSHLQAQGPSVETLFELYDRAGVARAILFGEPWSVATGAWERFPTRVIPFLAEGYANALHPDSSYLNPAGLEPLLSGGYVRGLGEIICRHSPFQLGASGGHVSAPANDVPADHPLLVEAYRLAGRHKAVVTLHQEWFFADELERALRAAPDTRFIWAHAGHGAANLVQMVLDRNPNLLADLSARTPWIGPGTVLLRPDGRFDSAWAALLRSHANRFLVGLDLFAPAHYRTPYVEQLVNYYRALLGQLEPEVAEQIAHLNADRISPL